MNVLDGSTRYPFRLHAEQTVLTTLLLEALGAHPQAVVRFGTQVGAVADKGTCVEVDSANGSEQAPYLVAADGAHSTVRASVGVSLPRSAYPTRALRVFTRSPLDELLPGLAPMTYVRDPVQSCSLLQLPDHWRIVLRTGPDEPVPQYIAGLASNELDIVDVHRYELAGGVLGAFRHGRVLFAGDAAHITSTAGGLNMNAGIHDAVDLGATLADVLAGRVPADTLDSWSRRRRAVMVEHVVPVSEARVAGVQDGDTTRLPAEIAAIQAIAADREATRAYLAAAAMLDTVPLPVRHT